MTTPPTMIVVPDAPALAEAAAQRVVDQIGIGGEHPAICLTGGSTPKRLYELLATPSWRSRIPWHRVHWFISDDRFVPQDDPLSNIGMARKAFLDACAPAPNVHAIPSAAMPSAAAQLYQSELRDFETSCRIGQPLFDLVLLGVGPDGHTASLFPTDSAALAERTAWGVGVSHPNVPPLVPRVSLTLPCLARTREMLFLASGADKQEILQQVVSGADLPAVHARAANGPTIWLIDRAAAPANLTDGHAGN